MRVPRARPSSIAVAVALLVDLGGACSSDDAAESGAGSGVELSAEAEQGRQVAESKGCTSCHRVDGDEGIGPAWGGLAGSEVELSDGTTVVADEQYLRTSILDPNAQIVDGFTGIMPERDLDDAEVDALVAYLQELGDQP